MYETERCIREVADKKEDLCRIQSSRSSFKHRTEVIQPIYYKKKRNAEEEVQKLPKIFP